MHRYKDWVEFAKILERAIENSPTWRIREKIREVRRNFSEYVRGEIPMMDLTDAQRIQLDHLIEWKS